MPDQVKNESAERLQTIDGRSEALAAGPESEQQFWVIDGALRRSRALMLFLFVNWLVLGVYVFRTPSRVVALIAFLLGLLTLVGGLGQRRGLALAKKAPLVILGERGVRFRRYTAGDYVELGWSEIAAVRREGVVIELVRTDDTVEILPSTVLGDEGRDRLERSLRSALGERAGVG